ncbi:MAG: hypothetical protein IE909_14300 [Campylobacterales bacterium]|nr:hypothetical protein [Campylobacterales bacterium]
MYIGFHPSNQIESSRHFRKKCYWSNNGSYFSKKLSEQLEFDSGCFFVSFYTRLLSSNFLNKYENRVLNFHPSILPACRSMDGFGDTVKSGSRFIGSTVHFVDEGIDTGKPLIQSCYPFQSDLSLNMNRHRVFVQQCKMLIQLVEWLNDGRIVGTNILDAKYEFSEFVPNLDSDIAINFTIDWQN